MIEQTNSGLGDNNLAFGDINIIKQSNNIASNFSEIINILGKRISSNNSDTESPISFSIEEKIKYNNVKTYLPVLNEYKIYTGKLGAIYKEFDEQGENKTFNTLSCIKLHYIKSLAYFQRISPEKKLIDIVTGNADQIIEMVEKEIMADIERSSNILETREAIHVSVQVIMIDAFMKCKILEEPK